MWVLHDHNPNHTVPSFVLDDYKGASKLVREHRGVFLVFDNPFDVRVQSYHL